MSHTTPVVIVRKDKRIRHKITHAVAFALTGGASGIVTAAEAANHASYNARTRQLQQPGATPRLQSAREFRAEHVPGSKEYRERHATV